MEEAGILLYQMPAKLLYEPSILMVVLLMQKNLLISSFLMTLTIRNSFLIARLYYRKLFRDLEKKLIMNSSAKKVLNITNNSL